MKVLSSQILSKLLKGEQTIAEYRWFCTSGEANSTTYIGHEDGTWSAIVHGEYYIIAIVCK